MALLALGGLKGVIFVIGLNIILSLYRHSTNKEQVRNLSKKRTLFQTIDSFVGFCYMLVISLLLFRRS